MIEFSFVSHSITRSQIIITKVLSLYHYRPIGSNFACCETHNFRNSNFNLMMLSKPTKHFSSFVRIVCRFNIPLLSFAYLYNSFLGNNQILLNIHMELDGDDDENFSFHEFLGGYEKLLTEHFFCQN